MDATLTVEQFAKERGVSAYTVRKWLREKRITGHKIGRDWHISRHQPMLFVYTHSLSPKTVSATGRLTRLGRQYVDAMRPHFHVGAIDALARDHFLVGRRYQIEIGEMSGPVDFHGGPALQVVIHWKEVE